MNDCRTRYACRFDVSIVCIQKGDGGVGNYKVYWGLMIRYVMYV